MFFIAFVKHLVGALEKHDFIIYIFSVQNVEGFGHTVKEVTAPRIGHDGNLFHFLLGAKLVKLFYKRRRHIVDAEKSYILKGVHRF